MSTLDISFTDLRSTVGDYLGYGTDSATWSSLELARVDKVIQEGVRRFYHPSPLPGEAKAHQWGFLRPKYSFNTVASDFDYDLPADFMQIIERIAFDNSENRNNVIQIVEASRIMEAKMVNDDASTPRLAAVRAKSQTAGSAQTFELLLYPQPDAIYTLHFRYAIMPDKLSTTNLYPYGGAWHASTIQSSCLAVAEEFYNDEQTIHAGRYLERLAASISQDRRSGPLTFGYNGDGGVADYEPPTFYVSYDGTIPS